MITDQDGSLEIEIPSEPKEVFLSYSRADGEKVAPIKRAILMAGASLWMDEEIDGATLWGAEIAKAIMNSKVMLLVASRGSLESHNVTKEISIASEEGKQILPVFLEPADVPFHLKYQLAGIQRIEFHRGDQEKNLAAILKALRHAGVKFRPPRPQIEAKPTTWVTPEKAALALKNGDGAGVKIALIDSGVEVSHPALNGIRLLHDLAVEDDGIQLRAVENAENDVFGHGTAMAEIIRKIAPRVEIGSIRVLGLEGGARDAGTREGVRQAFDLNYDVILVSLGSRSVQTLALYKEWIDEAFLRGIHIVTACNNDYYDTTEWPGHFPTTLSVNMARSTDPLSVFYKAGSLIQFAARGTGLDVAWKNGERKEQTGSTFAAAHVAGLLARILSRCGPMSPLLAQALLREIATPWSNAVAASNVAYSV